MKIVMLSNYFNHHQSTLSDALWQQTGGNFHFVETGAMSPARKALGYPEMQRDYVLKFRDSSKVVRQLLWEADVVIAGSAPETLIRQRIKAGKLLFRCSERPLRKGPEPLKFLPRWIRWHWRNPGGKPIYLLCASAYAAEDYEKFGLFRNRAFRWGYFPETKRYEDVDGLLEQKDGTEILWCGRFLDWKRPEDALAVARKLRQEGCRFRLNFLGSGEQEANLVKLTADYDLGDCVRFLGTGSPEQVRSHMERAGIFLFTSDHREGWGAVVNEAMNSGCAVVAGSAAGAVPFLVEDGVNGVIYESGNREMLYEKVKTLLEHPQLQKQLGQRAYETITQTWNGENAAKRLIRLAERILAADPPEAAFQDGPCSLAKAVKEK